jgi:CheY-like chemotaxis protein
MKPVEVLLIEDNAGDILLIHQALAGERFPISLHVAVDGEQGVQMLAARQFDPDLVILDLNIPKVSGLSFLAQCPLAAPVVVFTSSCNPQDRLCSFELGAKEFVQKSTDLPEFVRQISRIVRHWGGPELTRTFHPVQ